MDTRTEEEIVAEALDILDTKPKTTDDMKRLIELAHELEETLANKGGTQ